MENEHRGLALAVLGMVFIVAVIAAVLMFSGSQKSTGAVSGLTGQTTCDSPCTFAFGASPAEITMQTERFVRRGFVPVGKVQTTYANGREAEGQCLCPPIGALKNAGEDFQVIGIRPEGIPAPYDVEVDGAEYEVSEAP